MKYILLILIVLSGCKPQKGFNYKKLHKMNKKAENRWVRNDYYR